MQGSIESHNIQFILRNVGEIKYAMWRRYFSFFQGVKSANGRLFKDFYNEEKMKKNKSNGVLYFIIVSKLLRERRQHR